LPNTVNTDGIDAQYNNGVLTIKLAQRAEAKPKQIKVNVGSPKSIESKKPESQTHTASKGQVA
jgi:HSP20 family protein